MLRSSTSTAKGANKFPPDQIQSKFVGRGSELGALLAALHEGRAGRGSTWVVSGPAGIGKSRLLDELERLGSQDGWEIRRGYCIRDSESPFFVWRQIFRQFADLGITPTPRKLGPDQPPARLVSQAPAGNLATAALRSRLTVQTRTEEETILSYLDLVEQIASATPLLILLDDFQWAERMAIRALYLISRGVRRLPVMIAVGRRDDGVASRMPSQDPDWEPIEHLRRGGTVHTLELGPLTEGESLTVAQAVLGEFEVSHSPPATLRRAIKAAGGSPFFIIETASAYKQRPDPTRRATNPDPDGPAVSMFHRGVESVVEERLSTLPENHRQALQIAAHLGREFDAEGIRVGLSSAPLEVAHLLENLVRDRWLVAEPGYSPRRYRFSQGITWEVIRDSPPQPDLRAAFRRLAHWWKFRYTEDLSTLARLQILGGDAAAAIAALRLAIRIAIRRQDWPFLLGYFRRWAEIVPAATRDRRQLFDYFGRALPIVWRAGARDVTEGLVRQLLSLSPPPRDRWEALITLAALELTRSPARTSELVESVQLQIQGVDRTGLRRLRARIRFVQAMVSSVADPSTQSLPRARRTLPVLARLGMVEEQVRLCLNLVFPLMTSGNLRVARSFLENARSLMRSHRIQGTTLDALLQDAECAILDAGDATPKVVRAHQALVQLHRSQGLPVLEASALVNLARAQIAAGDLDRAWASCEASRQIAQRLDLPRILGGVELFRSTILERRGQWEEALRLVKEARSIVRDAGVAKWEVFCDLGLARALAETGNLPAARMRLRQVERAISELPRETIPEVLLAKARLVELAGGDGAARTIARHAFRVAQQVGSFEQKYLALAYLGRWEARHGTAESARRYEEEFDRLCERAGFDSERVRSALRLFIGPSTAPPGLSTAAKSEAGAPGSSEAFTKPAVAFPQRILIHLFGQGAVVGAGLDQDSVPNSLTQAGMAESFDAPRSRFAKALRRLEARGWVAKTSRHISGRGRIGFAYFLTADGVQLAQAPEIR